MVLIFSYFVSNHNLSPCPAVVEISQKFEYPSRNGVEKEGTPLTPKDELAGWVAISSNDCDRTGFLMLGAWNSEESLL